VTQEAMALGLVVVGTNTGGTKEILINYETGLTFAPEDVQGLAEHIARLAFDPDLCAHLSNAGRKIVLEGFTLEKMVREIEDYLSDCLVNIAER
jgi:glycosyltransferase involved in cell wall biosynthesis